MPYRKETFVNGRFYHIMNKGVADNPIFLNQQDRQIFLDILDFYRFGSGFSSFSRVRRLEKKSKLFKKLLKEHYSKKNLMVEIHAFCLMSNHYHLMLKQKQTTGVQNFIRLVQNSYAKYFNTRYERNGPLFQSVFKAVPIESNEQFIHTVRYILINPSSAGVVSSFRQLVNYRWSCLGDYLGIFKRKFLTKDFYLSQFSSKKELREFVKAEFDGSQKGNIPYRQGYTDKA